MRKKEEATTLSLRFTSLEAGLSIIFRTQAELDFFLFNTITTSKKLEHFR
jgi:hypothetical protein